MLLDVVMMTRPGLLSLKSFLLLFSLSTSAFLHQGRGCLLVILSMCRITAKVTSCTARWPPQYAPAPANFEIGSRTPGHAQLGANLWSGGKNCPQTMGVPNLKGVALSVCEILAHFAAVH